MKKALVVDDNTNNLTLEKDLLEIAGFEVFISENATDGIASARRSESASLCVNNWWVFFLAAMRLPKALALCTNKKQSGIVRDKKEDKGKKKK